MGKLLSKIEHIIDDFNIKTKLTIFYVICMLIPIIITDGVIFGIIYVNAVESRERLMESMASSAYFDFNSYIEDTVKVSNTIYSNRVISDFLEKDYANETEYFDAFRGIKDIIGSMGTISNTTVGLYTENETITNGSNIYKLSEYEDTEWYKYFKSSENEMILYVYNDDNSIPSRGRRRFSLIRNLDFYKGENYEKILKVDIDYNVLIRLMDSDSYTMPIYVCAGDRIIFSNRGHNSYADDYEKFDKFDDAAYSREWETYGLTFGIYVLNSGRTGLSYLRDYISLFILLLAFNIILPLIFSYILNRSFVRRLSKLNDAFGSVESDSQKQIVDARGSDEIGALMRNYNSMVTKSNELIKTVYQDRLDKQESDLARQKAELLALHSQINPHFLFNVLESIRMHSIIKHEDETASMIEQLAILERQNINWSEDLVPIESEIKFTQAYLRLQKYRFADRLNYEVEIEPWSKDILIPKLTIVTFVENACVHGIEKKAVPCWIYVRVYGKDEDLYIEIEDTGTGMDEDTVVDFKNKMNECTIESIEKDKHVGIVNACLRLKMVTNDKARFELESEEGIGTIITIKIPKEELSKNGEI